MASSVDSTVSQLPPTPPLSVSDDGKVEMSHQPLPPNRYSYPEQATTSSPRTQTPSSSSSSSLLQTLTIPSQYLSQYRSFILRNSSSVSQIESALRSLTYLIPGRFRDAEIASESLHSGIQLLSLYHDSILLRAVGRLPGMPRAAPRDRYTRFWMKESGLYRKVGMFLQVLQYTELLWEMAAKRQGEKIRWRVVLLLEGLKALCRLLLLRITGGRMVVPPMPERELPKEGENEAKTELEILEEAEAKVAMKDEETLRFEKGQDWTMPRTRLPLPNLPNPSDISSFLLSKVLTADDIKPATALLSRVQGTAQLAEVLHILRPVIYTVAMSRSKDKKSWYPWLLGLSIELAARQLRTEGASKGRRETKLESEEWSRRAWAMGWWGVRGAFYENVTKGVINTITGSRVVPNIVGGIVQDYQFLWENYSAATNDM